jgi:four helix bundle protein
MNHEKLDCYRALIFMAEEVARRVTRWPRGYGYLTDQISRAMASSVLNLAEGNGKMREGLERRRFFRISMGSISEVAASLDSGPYHRPRSVFCSRFTVHCSLISVLRL